ncbi:MAG: HEPN domain-containing protein, partial [Pyrinomonadaceae bacterium]
MRELVHRDLTDAAISSLSSDRRFATAYNAVLQLSKMAVACAGYRLTIGLGHHQKTFDAAKLALGPSSENLVYYFGICRRKRNFIDYDHAEVATETEAAELLEKAREFQVLVEEWIIKY